MGTICKNSKKTNGVDEMGVDEMGINRQDARLSKRRRDHKMTKGQKRLEIHENGMSGPLKGATWRTLGHKKGTMAL